MQLLRERGGAREKFYEGASFQTCLNPVQHTTFRASIIALCLVLGTIGH